ncbi:alpha/beta hydrolase [Sporichthya polymorpha]|uniref:alpha/beta hydrolase n=1 Tax=Sporichthya polymorpha TaxID=35751 RepID=UPI00035D38BF|nr:alpha/beta hydrolase [Sporichthya polymorpha]
MWRARVGTAVLTGLLLTGLPAPGNAATGGWGPDPGVAAPESRAKQQTKQTQKPGARAEGPAKPTTPKATHRYGDHGTASTLDVYLPPAEVGRTGAKLPTVVLVHGGAWTRGSRASMAPMARELARQGYVAVAVNYRLATQARWPAQRDDVSAAVSYLRRNADRFNIDRRRMALLGSSAGGHIAAAVATAGDGRDRFRGVVVLSGLLNPVTVTKQAPDFEDAVVQDKLLRCDPTECPDVYRDATPAAALNRRDVPSLLFHSEGENPFDTAQAREFAARSRGVGVPSTLKVLAGDQHGAAYWPRISEFALSWLATRLR